MAESKEAFFFLAKLSQKKEKKIWKFLANFLHF